MAHFKTGQKVVEKGTTLQGIITGVRMVNGRQQLTSIDIDELWLAGWYNADKFELIEEPERIEIPQELAVWIEDQRSYGCGDSLILRHLYDTYFSGKFDDKTYEFIRLRGDDVAKVIIDGVYEVEKEPLWVIRAGKSGSSHAFIYQTDRGLETCTCPTHFPKNLDGNKFRFTNKALTEFCAKYGKNFWEFAEVVPEELL